MSTRRSLVTAALAGSALLAAIAPLRWRRLRWHVRPAHRARRAPRSASATSPPAAPGVVVGWQENAPGGDKRVWMRRSTDGGAAFRRAARLDDRQSREIRWTTCDGWAFATYTFRESG